jgi:hypothetical protein
LAARGTERSGGTTGTFSTRSTKKRRKNDLDIVREVLKVTKQVPSERVCDFSVGKTAEGELTKRACRNIALEELLRWQDGGMKVQALVIDPWPVSITTHYR